MQMASTVSYICAPYISDKEGLVFYEGLNMEYLI